MRQSSEMKHQLNFRLLSGTYAVTRLATDALVPEWATRGEFTSISRTGEELSIVCPLENCPDDGAPRKRWACLKLEGTFAFSLTGVLLSFIRPLSENNVPIFAVSTFDTDYVLIPEELKVEAIVVLQNAGHNLRQ